MSVRSDRAGGDRAKVVTSFETNSIRRSLVDQFSLAAHGITVKEVFRNLAPSGLYEEAIRHEPEPVSPTPVVSLPTPEKRQAVLRKTNESCGTRFGKNVWWGPVNFPLDETTFSINRERAIDYLNTRPRIYCVDGYAGWDPATRLKIRVICARPYHALFMHNMLIRPTDAELETFGEPEFVIYNAGGFPANRYTTGMTSRTSVDLSIERCEVVLLGTEYAGEMKKAVFTMMNYLLPAKGILSMHCSATSDRNTGKSSILFGLSGTGKTTLSADPKRYLIGDDEHGWSDTGIFNIEGGCYAKAVYLTRESEPDIFEALRFGAVLENVVYDKSHHHVDFNNTTITQNTRGAYPIEFMRNAKIPCVADHPTDIIFLTCDAFGVLQRFRSSHRSRRCTTSSAGTPPKWPAPRWGSPNRRQRSRLLRRPVPRLASGCLREVAGRKDPSAQRQCLAGQHWLVWRSVRHGSRMPLRFTRAVVDGIHSGNLRTVPTAHDRL